MTSVLVFFATPVCRALRLIDQPDDRKLHAAPTPLLGGLALVIAALPLSFAAMAITPYLALSKAAAVYIASTGAIALIGMADDRHSLSANGRILLTAMVFLAAASIEPFFNVRVLDFSLGAYSFELGLWNTTFSVFFTALCCVGLVNAVNMADGKNGLVISLCIGWLLAIATRSPPSILPFIFVLLACLIVLLLANLSGKLFLGDGGSYGFAAAIGLLTIWIYNSTDDTQSRLFHAEEAMLLFAVPVIDSFRLTFARIRRGQSPMAGDRDHLHHHLLDSFGWPGGLVIYLLVALLPIASLLWWRAAG